MPKKEEKETRKNDPRQTAWDAFLERYQEQNPVKFAEKQAKGEFSSIPDSFIG